MMLIQLDNGERFEKEHVRFVGAGVALAGEVGDNEELIITLSGEGEAGGIAASEVVVTDSGAFYAGAEVEAVLAEIGTSIASFGPGGGAAVQSGYVEFEESAGAGVYTGAIELPDNVQILYVWFETTAAWDADTAVLDVGYTGLGAGFVNDHDVKAGGVEAVPLWDLATDVPYILTGDEDFLTTMTCTGTGGTTGRTRVGVVYVVPTVGDAPVKA
jgi:hypothetical protein